jgi:hypothetical protein
MKRHYSVMVAAITVLPVLLTGASAAAKARTAGGTHAAISGGKWGAAQKVRGLAALNQGGSAQVSIVSCASAGNCGASGYYTDNSGREVFVADEKNGTWGTARELPGLSTLNQSGLADVSSLSCASAGNCGLGGFYSGPSGTFQAFVADEINDTWGKVRDVPGIAALNQGGNASVDSVSCASAGNCSAGGSYRDGSGLDQAFVVSETNGTWGTAREVPGSAALNKGGLAVVHSVSCASAGNCSAGGSYGDVAGKYHLQAFVVNETHGTWGTAEEVPGSAVLNAGGDAEISSVSCPSAGTCSAGGGYADSSLNGGAFVVNENHGTWGTARKVLGTAAFNKGGASIVSVSCGSAGNCGAGGPYEASARGNLTTQVFVVNETHGKWGSAEEVPGTGKLNQGGQASIGSVSCAAAGDCSAGGSYFDAGNNNQAFVVSESNGTWGKAEEVPGIAALTRLGAGITSVSCATPGHCSAGGFYSRGPVQAASLEGFVVGER